LSIPYHVARAGQQALSGCDETFCTKTPAWTASGKRAALLSRNVNGIVEAQVDAVAAHPHVILSAAKDPGF
jgi:hypothetical protein